MKIRKNKKKYSVRFVVIALLLALFVPVAGLSNNPVTINGKVRVATNALVYSKGDIHLIADKGNAAVLNNGTLMFNDALVFYSNATKDGMLKNQPNGIVRWTGTATPDIRVRKTFESPEARFRVSFPFNVNIEDITYSDGTPFPYNTQFALAWYNASKRAQYGVIEEAWTLFETDENQLNAGEGYFLSLKYRGGNTSETLDFPISSIHDALYLFSYGDKSKQLSYYKNSIFAGNESAGWNIIGGQNSCAFDVNSLSTSYAGALWYWDVSLSSWDFAVPEFSTTLTLSPYMPFYLQSAGIGEAFDFKTNGLSLTDRNPISARSTMVGDYEEEYSARSSMLGLTNGERDVLFLSLSDNADSEFSDKTLLLFNKEYEEGYKPVKDGIKMFSATSRRPEIWSLKEADEKAYSLSLNRLPYRDKREVKLGVSVPAAGEYTFRLNHPERNAFEKVFLLDKETGEETDLIQQNYSFTADGRNTTTGRFSLFVNNSLSDGQDELVEAFAYVNDGTLWVRNLSVSDCITVFDVSGRKLLSEMVTSQEFVTHLSLPGTYIIKVAGERPCILKVFNE